AHRRARPGEEGRVDAESQREGHPRHGPEPGDDRHALAGAALREQVPAAELGHLTGETHRSTLPSRSVSTRSTWLVIASRSWETITTAPPAATVRRRSEERRVGKEGRCQEASC